MPRDRILTAIDQAAAAAVGASDALTAVVAELGAARAVAASEGVRPFVDHVMTHGGHEVRVDATAALRVYERAIATLRSEAVRILVQEDGMSFSDVAVLLRVTRQTVTRLYHLAAEGPLDGVD
jgi:hypothetical protein